MPHPFLVPHRQAEQFPCNLNYMPFLGVPMHAELTIVKETESGEFALARFYIDGVDVGGRSRTTSKHTRAGIPVDSHRLLLRGYMPRHTFPSDLGASTVFKED